MVLGVFARCVVVVIFVDGLFTASSISIGVGKGICSKLEFVSQVGTVGVVGPEEG